MARTPVDAVRTSGCGAHSRDSCRGEDGTGVPVRSGLGLVRPWASGLPPGASSAWRAHGLVAANPRSTLSNLDTNKASCCQTCNGCDPTGGDECEECSRSERPPGIDTPYFHRGDDHPELDTTFYWRTGTSVNLSTQVRATTTPRSAPVPAGPDSFAGAGPSPTLQLWLNEISKLRYSSAAWQGLAELQKHHGFLWLHSCEQLCALFSKRRKRLVKAFGAVHREACKKLLKRVILDNGKGLPASTSASVFGLSHAQALRAAYQACLNAGNPIGKCSAAQLQANLADCLAPTLYDSFQWLTFGAAACGQGPPPTTLCPNANPCFITELEKAYKLLFPGQKHAAFAATYKALLPCHYYRFPTKTVEGYDKLTFLSYESVLKTFGAVHEPFVKKPAGHKFAKSDDNVSTWYEAKTILAIGIAKGCRWAGATNFLNGKLSPVLPVGGLNPWQFAAARLGQSSSADGKKQIMALITENKNKPQIGPLNCP